MKKIIFAFIIIVLIIFGMPLSLSASSKNILITEVQTGSSTSASEEFVEIYNSSANDLDLSGWSMYYKSATGTSWTKKASVISGTLKPGDFWLFSANLPGNTSFSSGLSGTGGNLQIRDKLGNTIDQFGWGNANASLGTPASISAGGQSMYRIYNFETKIFSNTDNNFADFDISDAPTPAKFPIQDTAEQDTEVAVYPKLELSEIFPDPTSPQVDTADEFIEIYNPTDQEVDLSGWKLKDESGDEYLIKDKSIAPKSRLAIFVLESKITLNNTGDIITLLDPNGSLVDESADYESAEPGLSWSKISGVWQWTVGPTANAENADIYIEDTLVPASAVNKVKKTATKKSTAKSSAKKLTSTSSPKTSKVQSSSALANTSPELQSESKSSSSNIWPWLLGAAGIATIGYAIYEYRTEIQLFVRKLRRH